MIKQERWYVAGPMTGLELFNFPMFDMVASEYRDKGHFCFNPADNDRELLGKHEAWLPGPEDHDGDWKVWKIEGAPGLRKMLGDDLAWIAAEADGIVMLPGWEKSSGAFAEWALARALGLKIEYA